MCGIFAYSGPRPVTGVLLKGLKNLEYRGYDSSGVAFFKDRRIHRKRATGDISHLEKILSDKGPKNSLGMGHTRWATHGPPTRQNAHPHKAGGIYVVHNGVIENEQALREMFPGKTLESETDSELIACLINFYYQSEPDFFSAVLKARKLLKGAYAVVVMCEKHPEELAAFKNGPPLMIAENDKGEIYVSSDPNAVARRTTQRILFLEDGDAFYLKENKWHILDSQSGSVQRSFSDFDLQQSSSEKKGFSHFMLKEICEQPEILKNIISSHIKGGKFQFLKGKIPENFNQLLLESGELIMVACGSSYHSALFCRYIMEDLAGLSTKAEIASEFVYRKPVISSKSLLLLISQSGETADTLTALKWAGQRKIPSLCLCNVKNSTLRRQSLYSLYMNAGREVAVASTKAFSASLSVLSLLAWHLSRLKGVLDKQREEKLLKDLLSLPSYMQKALNYDTFFKKQAKEFKKFKGFLYLGRGPYHPIALEGALKLKEIAYTHAEGYPSGEMKHGPLALVDKDKLIVFLMPSTKDPIYEKTLVNLKEAKARGGCIMALGGGPELEDLCHYHLPLPEMDSAFHPLLSLVCVQLMAYFVSLECGYNADKPRNLAKSVTVE